jgi:hypothetical protein
MFQCLHQNGQLILGYVNTSNGGRAQANVLHGGDGEDSVDDWYTSSYGNLIDGIFFDVGPTSTQGMTGTLYCPQSSSNDCQGYYIGLYKSLHSSSSYTGKCGNGAQACVFLNASGVDSDWVLNDPQGPAADWIVTYERPVYGADNNAGCGNPDGQDYLGVTETGSTSPLGFCPAGQSGSPCADTQAPPNWYFNSSNSPKEAHVLRRPASDGILSNSDLDAIVAKSRSAYGSPGLFYVHDEACASNGAQYSHVSPYFEHLATSFGSAVTASKFGSGSGSIHAQIVGAPDVSDVLDCNSACTSFTNHIPTGATVTLTANPDSGSLSNGFSVNGVGCGNPCTVTVSTTTSVVASFSTLLLNTSVTWAQNALSCEAGSQFGMGNFRVQFMNAGQNVSSARVQVGPFQFAVSPQMTVSYGLIFDGFYYSGPTNVPAGGNQYINTSVYNVTTGVHTVSLWVRPPIGMCPPTWVTVSGSPTYVTVVSAP